MSTSHERKKQARGKALIFGVASLALYAGIFSLADVITPLFAKGGIYCLLPVASVFLFSYVHANFAGNVWTALGIEASSRIERSRESDAAKKHTDKRPRKALRV